MRKIVGQIAPSCPVSRHTIYLVNPRDARHFADGLIVRAVWTKEGIQPCREGRARVLLVSDEEGAVTFSKALFTSIPSVAPGDFLVLDADEPSWM
jgi:hypothetical protein